MLRISIAKFFRKYRNFGDHKFQDAGNFYIYSEKQLKDAVSNIQYNKVIVPDICNQN